MSLNVLNHAPKLFHTQGDFQTLPNVKNLSGSDFVCTLGVFQANVKNFDGWGWFSIFPVLKSKVQFKN